ncbi:hypothetical protein PUMCH_002015 [Australozyma saopauloensis]|uniref:Uncharacterized protein n=1 Tax=Australozyma saopauloensis TaxID=291208 RepID=A0AAX4H815_9ASCO|nr:hypothetical protein PUMCH_002015 [[Candida] saopauloensis]
MSLLTVPVYNPNYDIPTSYSVRDYQIACLPSGLLILLISDPSSHLFSAAMTVRGGHFNDPIKIPGLAHLCEHLVVGAKATKLYLEVARTGGKSTAYTSSDQTCFGFSISSYANGPEGDLYATAVESALSKLSNYFSLSKFHLEVTQREIRAVNEEHIENTKNVDKILWHGLKLLTSDTHPFHRFSTGNLSTLSDVSLKSLNNSAKKYYTETFQPLNMSLVLKGPQTLNHLKKMAIIHFSTITTTNRLSRRSSGNFQQKMIGLPTSRSSSESIKVIKTLQLQMDIFQDSDLNCIYIKADFEPRLRLCFPMMSGSEQVSDPVQRQLCNILGSESPGYWCHFLKNKTQLLQHVFVSIEHISLTQTVLTCDLEMTRKGMRNLPEVISLFFHFVQERVTQSPLEDLCGVLDNFGKLEEEHYIRQKPLRTPLDEVCDLSARLTISEAENPDFIKGFKPWEGGLHSCKEFVSITRAFISRNNVRIEVLDKTFLHQSSLAENLHKKPERDPFYGFDYMKFNVSLMSLSRSNVDFNIPVSREILSVSVPFAQEDHTNFGQVEHRDLKVHQQLPTIQLDDDYFELWSHNVCNIEHSVASLNVRFEGLIDNAANLVGIEIISIVIGEKLKYNLYPYELRGGNWGLYPNVNGEPAILITYRGEQNLLSPVMNHIFTELDNITSKSSELTYDDLKRARVYLRRLYHSFEDTQGFAKMEVTTHLILEGGSISIEKRIEALELFDVDNLRTLALELQNTRLSTIGLVLGSLEQFDFDEIRSGCSRKNSEGEIDKFNIPNTSVLLPEGAHYQYELEAIENDPSSVVYYYLQMGCRLDTTLFTVSKLLQFYISTASFEALRTKRSLSYSLLSGMKLYKDTFGLFICIPANNKDCKVIVEQVEDFLIELENDLETFDASSWETFVSRFLTSVETGGDENDFPSSLFANLLPLICSSDFDTSSESFGEHWNHLSQILNMTYRFGGKRCEEGIDLSIIKSLSHEAFVRIFQNKISVNSSRRSILILTKAAGFESFENRINNRALFYYNFLSHFGIVISIEDLSKCLHECEDTETFSDFNKRMKKYLHSTSDRLKFQKLRLYQKLEEVLSANPSNSCKATRHNSVRRVRFTRIEDIRKHCLMVQMIRRPSFKKSCAEAQVLSDLVEIYDAPLTS